MRACLIASSAALLSASILISAISASDLDQARPTSQAIAAAPTYNEQVAPILYQRCTTCHRPNGVGPMSLLAYAEARPWARAMREAVSSRTMPPWHADKAYGPFANDMSLSDAEVETIVAWVNGGAPEGADSTRPVPPKYTDGWALGTPDAVFTMLEPFSVPAEGTLEYEFLRVPTNLTEDKWVEAIEVRPGVPAVVHHVIVRVLEPVRTTRPILARIDPQYMMPEEKSRAFNPRRPRGDYLVGVGAGTGPTILKPGTAKLLKAGSTLVLEMHYTSNGTAAADRTSVGLRFAKQPPDEEIRTVTLLNDVFEIPPGAPAYKVDAALTLEQPVKMWSIFAHTHLRGKKWEYRVVYPDGRQQTILSVPRYDFNWQHEYVFKEPLRLPKGTRVESSAWYDNSSKNPSNPDPTKLVVFGEQTWDEMQFSTFNVSIDRSADSAQDAVAPGRQGSAGGRVQ
jgi:hypothetical protein